MFPQFGRLPVALAATLFLAATASRLFGYALEGPTWPAGSTVNVRLAFTGPSSGHLQDGFNTFNASAADALALWNQQIDLTKFSWNTSSIGGSQRDGQNTAFFSSTVYGQTYGPAIAVTVYFYNGSTMLEADNLFNSALLWDSYRGPLQYNARKGKYVYDFHRVAIHEFGHTLGLAHPDDAGQSVTAIMNRHVSDLDHYVDDDIAGVASLYSRRITSSLSPVTLSLGDDYHFYIYANNSPTLWQATGLPPGLSMDAHTGEISGTVTISGDYQVNISVSGIGTVSGSMLIHVVVPPTNQRIETFAASFKRLLQDSARERIYASESDWVWVLDCQTLDLITFLYIGAPAQGMAISSDGKRLLVANSGAGNSIPAFDLDTYGLVRSIPTPFPTYDVAVGFDGRVYASRWGDAGSGTVAAIDESSGRFLGIINPFSSGTGYLVMSPDRKTLFLGPDSHSNPTLYAFDVASAIPRVQQAGPNRLNGFLEQLVISHDGSTLCPEDGGSGTLLEIPTSDLTATLRSYTMPDNGFTRGAVAFSPDDKVIYITDDAYAAGLPLTIRAYDRTTGTFISSIDTPTRRPSDMVTDTTGLYLYAAGFDGLDVFYTGRRASAAAFSLPKTLVNVSTRVRVATEDNVEIGGFIIAGTEAKKVMVRAIAPSLTQFGVSGVLADPVLELHDTTGGTIASNDNWNSHRLDVMTSGFAPSDEHESAIVTSLQPGSYTAILHGVGGSAGVALFELYDLDPQKSKIVNISTRGNVGIGDNVMIGGFIVGGNQRTTVIVRALGPTLTDFGVSGALADPTLELHDGNGAIIAQNDDWKSGQQQAIQNFGFAPPQDTEAAILATLQPGNYTAIVRGKNDTTGVALVEVYNLDAN
jgi:hypothetical protein